jgi:hypothetical protein
MATVALRLFGVPEIERDGRPVHVARRKALALLAYLAATQQPQPRDLLAALLWPDLGQENARAMVRHALSALAQLAYIHAQRGQDAYAAALVYARRWLDLDPLHEPAQRALMRLYAWSGDRAAALQQYAACERLLAAELGVPPDAATAQLAAQIRASTLPGPEAGWPEEVRWRRAAATPALQPVPRPRPTTARRDAVQALRTRWAPGARSPRTIPSRLPGSATRSVGSGGAACGAGRGLPSSCPPASRYPMTAQQKHRRSVANARGAGTASAPTFPPAVMAVQ